jgi:hypothetical protein
MPVTSPSLQKYQAPGPPPTFISAPSTPSGSLEQNAIATDQLSQNLSLANFKQLYPQLQAAQTQNLNNLNQQVSGEINPQLQNVWARSGLQNALGSTAGWSLGTGTAGMANIARNLGLSQMGYQQQVQNNLNTATEMYRPWSFGLSGGDLANVQLADIAGQNTANQAAYAYAVQGNEFNTQIANQQSVLSANANNAQTSNIVGGVSSGVSALLSIALA